MVASAAPIAMSTGGTQQAEHGAGSLYCLACLLSPIQLLHLLQPHSAWGWVSTLEPGALSSISPVGSEGACIRTTWGACSDPHSEHPLDPLRQKL